MKKVLSQMPLLGLALGIFLLFPPDLSSDHQAHNRSFYMLSIIVPSILIILTALRLTNILRKINRLQLINVAVIVLFTFIHVSPQSMLFKYHHQSASTVEHQCCIPQAVGGIQETIATVVITKISHIPINQPSSIEPILIKSTNNRSPPLYS